MEFDEEDHIPLLPTNPQSLESSSHSPPFLTSQGSIVGGSSSPDPLTFSVPLSTSHHHSGHGESLRRSRRNSHYEQSTSHFTVDVVILRNAIRRGLGWLLTGTKIRILLVCFVIFFCIYLFVNTNIATEPTYVSISQAHPYIWEITESDPQVLEVQVLPPEPETYYPDDAQVFILFQGELENNWETIYNWSIDLIHEHEKHLFDAYKESKYESLQFKLTTNIEYIFTAQVHVSNVPKTVHYQELFAALILIFSYGLIISEIIDRSLAAMVGALVALSVYSTLHEAPNFEEIVSWIDFQTCGLLFGMMILVGVFSETGFFEWAAVRAYKIARGDGRHKDSVVLMRLAIILCIFTAVVSAFLDNVTTILLLSKVTIRLCDVLGVDPVPILIAEALFSNIGGTATPIGDPPNIMIVNNAEIAETVDFGVFFLHVGPGIVLAGWVCTYVIERILAPHLQQRGAPLHIQREITIWENTLKTLRSDTEEERQVRKQLRQHIQNLQSIEEPDTAPPDISELERKYVIHDMNLFYITAFVLTIVIIGFFARSAFESALTPAVIAIVGALMLLLAAGINKMEEVLKTVEWQTLIFFSCLFVLMECLSELGLIDLIGETTAKIIEVAPAGNGRLSFAVVLIIWVSAIVSAFVDNIPYTAAMIPVIVRLAKDDNLPLQPLVWSLVYGACLGGNGTLTGASANVVAAGISGSNGHPISFIRFTKMGIPITFVSLVVVTIYMLIFHVLIPWY